MVRVRSAEVKNYFFRPPVRLPGTLAPARRASLRPIAIACLRLVTFLPERPDLSVPCLRSCIARFTLLCAFLPYRAMSAAPPRSGVRNVDERVHQRAVTPAFRCFLG